mgnify:CR=1 FL=1|jgi:hypothetical protein
MKFKDEQRLVFELFELVELVVSSFDCSTVETAPTSGEGYRNSSAQSSHQQEQVTSRGNSSLSGPLLA